MGMITIDCADPQGLARFWTAALNVEVAGDYGEFVMLAGPADGGPRLGLQRVPEPKEGKNRVHVDFGADDREAEVRRLIGLGATEIGRHAQPGLEWTVLEDPAGNVFCVSAKGAH